MLNFFFVPPQHRVGYVACVLVLWNAYLSSTANKNKGEEEESEDKEAVQN